MKFYGVISSFPDKYKCFLYTIIERFRIIKIFKLFINKKGFFNRLYKNNINLRFFVEVFLCLELFKYLTFFSDNSFNKHPSDEISIHDESVDVEMDNNHNFDSYVKGTVFVS